MVTSWVFGVRAGYNLAMRDVLRVTTQMSRVKTEDLYPPKDPP